MSASFQNISTNINNETSSISKNVKNETRNTKPELSDENSDDYLYILIPLIVLFGILILSALVYLMARNRNRWSHIYYERNVKRFKYQDKNDNDSDVTALLIHDLRESTEHLLQEQLYIGNNYETFENTRVNDRNAKNSNYRELYT